ncbi:MAG TPA: IgGFc-binding protein [Candidatus Kapabacteria bacterium]|nr:IgGFc-binding protein [Candidatus Kapabacteria bacterium]
MSRLAICTLLLSIFFVGSSRLFAQGYRGHDFWVCFPQNAVEEDGKVLSQSLYIAAESNAKGQIVNSMDGSEQPFSVGAGASTSVDVDTLLQITSSGCKSPLKGLLQVGKQSLHITSDHDITLYVVSHRPSSTDSYAAIPMQMLGEGYMAAGYAPLQSGSVAFTSQADMIATEDNTLVTVHLSAATKDSMPAGRTVMLVLNRGETVQFQSAPSVGTPSVGAPSVGAPSVGAPSDTEKDRLDLTGSTISASKPIAFFTGHTCAQIPSDIYYCDMLVEMEPPMDDWGTSFIVPKFAEKDCSVVRIIAGQDSTDVILDGVRIAQLSKGGFCEVDTLHHDAIIQTSKPALVAQYATSSQADVQKVGDPFLLFVIPNNRFIPEVTTVSVVEGGFSHYLNVVVPDSGLATLNIDGAFAASGKLANGSSVISKRIAPRAGSPAHYSIVTLKVLPGRHLVRCSAPIAVYSYGFGLYTNAFDSYGHACGQRLDAQ